MNTRTFNERLSAIDARIVCGSFTEAERLIGELTGAVSTDDDSQRRSWMTRDIEARTERLRKARERATSSSTEQREEQIRQQVMKGNPFTRFFDDVKFLLARLEVVTTELRQATEYARDLETKLNVVDQMARAMPEGAPIVAVLQCPENDTRHDLCGGCPACDDDDDDAEERARAFERVPGERCPPPITGIIMHWGPEKQKPARTLTKFFEENAPPRTMVVVAGPSSPISKSRYSTARGLICATCNDTGRVRIPLDSLTDSPSPITAEEAAQGYRQRPCRDCIETRDRSRAARPWLWIPYDDVTPIERINGIKNAGAYDLDFPLLASMIEAVEPTLARRIRAACDHDFPKREQGRVCEVLDTGITEENIPDLMPILGEWWKGQGMR